jgi:hypothetical protein
MNEGCLIFIQVSAGDGLPAQVCQQCVELVNTCYNFKLQCEKSDMTLRCYVSIRSQCEQQDEGQVKLKVHTPLCAFNLLLTLAFNIFLLTPLCLLLSLVYSSD